jgi:hypothetical protein
LFGGSSSRSSESGSLHPHGYHAPYDPDLGSWASAASSALGADWISVPHQTSNATVGNNEALLVEATWQEEAHWMSFHQAVQSLVRHSVAQQQQRQAQSSAASPSSTKSQSTASSHGSSLAQALSRQLVLPSDTVDIPPAESPADRKTRLALAQAQQDEWEIAAATSQHEATVFQTIGRSLLLQEEERPN